MWNDWNFQVKDEAGGALGRLGHTSAVINSIVQQLNGDDPLQRVSSLKCLRYMDIMPSAALAGYINCLKDSVMAVRLEACQVIYFLIYSSLVVLKRLIPIS